ncbi:uncharacterized protein LOC131651335 [Vicia villosa]|uniref:uncharacterized protein LOC131651335 n=1 Tax=Vicia villosa TaxID=3911 RepID=UPI00273AE787|nr:uncharacterized protein LOC131651335 [Vicia villosa]
MKENHIGQTGHTSPQDAFEDTQFDYYKSNPQDTHPMTNVESAEKYRVLEERCSLCRSKVEISQHLFVNCPFAKEIWLWFYKAVKTTSHPSTLEDWWTACNINRSKQFSLVLKVTIVYIKWFIWETRNWERFITITPTYKTTIQRIKSLLLLTGNNSKATTSSSMDEFQIIKAFNINIKPSRAQELPKSFGTLALLTRLRATAMVIRPSSYLVEFSAVLKAMEIVWGKGWQTNWIETDSLIVVQAFKKTFLGSVAN